MLLVTIHSLLLPLRRARFILASLGRVLAAPAFPISLWDVFVADVLTSMVRLP